MSLLQHLLLRRCNLIYAHVCEGMASEYQPAPPNLLSIWLNHETVSQHFSTSDSLARKFAAFARAGHHGVALFDGGACVSYAWMSTPTSPLPKHLPRKLGQGYWIYFCHTEETYRNRGLYSFCLRKLLAFAAAREAPRECIVHIDTQPENIPSQRAIQRAGFTVLGMFVTYRVPKTRLQWGHWGWKADPTISHPSALR
jgi:RimJ/RimL family protein N-acetyltransferase